MKKKMILFTVFALFLMIGGIGCEEDKVVLTDSNCVVLFDNSEKKESQWAILIDGKKYYPINLNKEYQKNGLVVDVKYSLLQTASVCSQNEGKLHQQIKILDIVDTKNNFECFCDESTGIEKDLIVGEWKLEKVQTVFKESRIYDYSYFDIKYTFNKNGVLVISSDLEFIWSNLGEFPFQLLENGSVIEIDKLTANFCVTDRNMRIDASILDGPILCLTKLK